MSIFKGSTAIVDRYKGSTLISKVYKGSTEIFNAYSEVSGSLPLVYESRVEHILKNYTLYGTASGAGVETENIVEDYLEQAYISTTSEGVVTSYNSIDLALFQIAQGETYTIKRFESSMELYTGFFTSKPIMGSVTYDETIHVPTPVGGNAFTFEAPITGWAAVRSSRSVAKQKSIVAVQGSTAPESYIPHGYKLPLTITSGAQSQDYPLYIGSTKLGAEEYLDYEAGKIYKMVGGDLTPTAPPAPLPAITAYKGENTLSSTETVGEVSVKGRIKETET